MVEKDQGKQSCSWENQKGIWWSIVVAPLIFNLGNY